MDIREIPLINNQVNKLIKKLDQYQINL